jgi:hypothetical protein
LKTCPGFLGTVSETRLIAPSIRLEILFDLVSDTPEEQIAAFLRIDQQTLKMWLMYLKPILVTAGLKA